jgi:hypothetical protein
MLKKTATLIFLLWGSVIPVIAQTKELQQEVKISGEISPVKSDVVLPELPKLNFSDMGIGSPFYPDFDQTFRLQKSNLSLSFPSFKQLEMSEKYFFYSGFATYNPLTFEFNNTQKDQLNNRFFILSKGKKTTYMGLGGYTQLSSSLGWQSSNKLAIDVGGFVVQQFESATLSQRNMMGVGIRTKYDLTDNVQFNSWGQYASSGANNNTLVGFNTLFPHSGIGSSVSVRIKSLSKIEGGVEYQYNESTKVWNLESQGRISLHF